MTPLRTMGNTIDIANGIASLASSDANFITGVNLVIDRGFRYNLVSDFKIYGKL